MLTDHSISWPEDADKHLLNIIKLSLEPLCIQIDNDFIVRNYWGNLAVFELEQLNIDRSANQLDFLVGLESIEEPITLKFIQVSPRCVAHIHMYKSHEKRYVTLFDVSDEHDYIRPIQQGANEAQLKNFYDQQLISKLERTQAELSSKKQEIEAASLLKSRFIASMSHEFRTPITSIIGYTEILLAELAKAELADTAASIIRRNAYFLLNMVNNILEKARLESGDIEISLSEIDLHETVMLIQHMFAALAEQKGIRFNVDVQADMPQYFLADELRLQQILINIIGNAIKFTTSGEVRLSLRYSDEAVIFCIKDTGAGIPAEDQQKIFQPFRRLSSQEQGAGLGLSITQRLLEVMGGSLQLDSEPGRGSAFTVILPAKELEPLEDDEAHLSKKQIFIIEDNQDISDLLTIFLAEMGLDSVVIADGANAEQQIVEEQPDLIIMDMNLPNKSGLDITASLRSRGYNKPIIAFSAAGLFATKEQALAAGCDDYIDKTDVNSRRLRKVLVRYLSCASTTKPDFTAELDALKEKYRQSLEQKRLVIQSTWNSCQSNQYDAVACKMLYTLTHNLAGSAGSYEFNDIAQYAKAVNACINTDYQVKDEQLLKQNVVQLIQTLESY